MHVRFAALYAGLIGVPLVNAVVMIGVGSDAAGTLPSARERMERFSERTWAIIVINVALSLIANVGLQSMLLPDAADVALGVMVLFLSAMLVYAEPFAALESGTSMLALVPMAVLRSMMLCWVNMPRILSLFAVQIVVTLGQVELGRLATPIGSRTNDLVTLAYVTVFSVPLSALFAVAYLDTLAQEQRSAQ